MTKPINIALIQDVHDAHSKQLYGRLVGYTSGMVAHDHRGELLDEVRRSQKSESYMAQLAHDRLKLLIDVNAQIKAFRALASKWQKYRGLVLSRDAASQLEEILEDKTHG